jgi:hypothetical protein
VHFRLGKIRIYTIEILAKSLDALSVTFYQPDSTLVEKSICNPFG